MPVHAAGAGVPETEQAAASSTDVEQCTISCEGKKFVLKFKSGRAFTASHDVLHRSALLSRVLSEIQLDGQSEASCAVVVQQSQIESWLDYLTHDDHCGLSDETAVNSLSVRCFCLDSVRTCSREQRV